MPPQWCPNSSRGCGPTTTWQWAPRCRFTEPASCSHFFTRAKLGHHISLRRGAWTAFIFAVWDAYSGSDGKTELPTQKSWSAQGCPPSSHSWVSAVSAGLSHVHRMEEGRIPKDLLYRELLGGSRPRGQPRLWFKDTCKRDMKCVGIDTSSWPPGKASRSLGTPGGTPCTVALSKPSGTALTTRRRREPPLSPALRTEFGHFDTKSGVSIRVDSIQIEVVSRHHQSRLDTLRKSIWFNSTFMCSTV